MASFSTRKVCSMSGGCKQTAATNCEGCSEAFCTKHFVDHRRVLAEDMDAIISEHNHFQQVFTQQPVELDQHPFTQIINGWEQESILRVQEKAKDLRQELLQLITARRDELSKKLRQLAEHMNESRANDNFIELDLQQWKENLDDLKDKLDSSSTFSLDYHEDVHLVRNPFITFTMENESFEQVFDNIVQIKQNGQAAVHDPSFNYTEVRGRNEYASGRHKIRLRIEQSADSWTFLGVNSKSALLQKQSCIAKSAYGWSNNNYFWLNGECHPNRSSSRVEMKTNDVVSLFFDCDRRRISMVNERTSAKYELSVNIEHCPLPWQLHVNLYEANSHVRILSS